MNKFKQIVSLCEKQGLLKIGKQGHYSAGPSGALLLENLRAEWLNSMVNNKDLSIFYGGSGNFAENYDCVREICTEELPFGMADVIQVHTNGRRKVIEDGDDVHEFSEYFKESFSLRCCVFMAPTVSTHFFHQWQKQRRIWWRKLSPIPGRYSITDPQTEENGSQTINIVAKYPWGQQLVETLQFKQDVHPMLNETQVMNRFHNKPVKSDYLASAISLNALYLNALCDAYEELPFNKTTRISFRLHRKLAPYKISFSIPTGLSGSILDDLEDLALYLCKKLRSINITCLMLPTYAKNNFEQQFGQYDKLGVPYTVILNEETLRSGILSLRSRDTTLKEQVHVNELPNYVELLFKNY